MSGFMENTASGAPEKPGRRDMGFKLPPARPIVPPVRHILADLTHSRQTLARLQPEQERLDRQRRTLDWPQRRRRYELREEVAAAERHLQEALAELGGLGVAVLDL